MPNSIYQIYIPDTVVGSVVSGDLVLRTVSNPIITKNPVFIDGWYYIEIDGAMIPMHWDGAESN